MDIYENWVIGRVGREQTSFFRANVSFTPESDTILFQFPNVLHTVNI